MNTFLDTPDCPVMLRCDGAPLFGRREMCVACERELIRRGQIKSKSHRKACPAKPKPAPAPVEKPVQQSKPRGRRYEIGGVTRTLTEWSQATGLNRDTIRWRLKQGLSADLVLAPARSLAPFTPVVIDGVAKSMKAWALEFGVAPSTAYHRASKGVTGRDLFAPPAPTAEKIDRDDIRRMAREFAEETIAKRGAR